MAEELKPCPFCGGTAHFYQNEIDFVPKWSAGCDECPAGLDACEDTKAEVAALWNHRPVALAQRQQPEPYGWHAAANGLFSVDKRCADVWKHHMGLDVTPVYAAPPAERLPLSQQDLAAGDLPERLDSLAEALAHECDRVTCTEAAREIERLQRSSPAESAEETPQEVAEQAAYFDAHAERFATAHAGIAAQCSSQPVSKSEPRG